VKPHPIIEEAVGVLCSRFEAGGYALTPVIDIGALIANADGSVDEEELEMLGYLFEALLGSHLGKEALRPLVRASLQVLLEAGLEPRARFLTEILVDCHAVEEGLTVALGVAFASEGLSNAERDIISTMAKCARMPQKQLDALIEKVRSRMEAA
jgi:hypothetical protein